MRLYGDLAPWFHLLTHPEEYAGEAEHIVRVAEAACKRAPATLLELGSGGGNSASHLKRRFSCALTDISAEMLALSASINPECEHIQGDMRTLRLGRLFDVVLIHDAISYMTSEADLRAAIKTAAVHVEPGGVAILLPDAVAETFASATEHGGKDASDGSALRYLMWTYDSDPNDSVHEADFAMILREPGRPPRLEHDHHVIGLFERDAWRDAIQAAGLVALTVDVDDPYANEHVVFVGRRS